MKSSISMALVLISPARGELLVSSFHSNQVFRYDEKNGAFIDIFISNAGG